MTLDRPIEVVAEGAGAYSAEVVLRDDILEFDCGVGYIFPFTGIEREWVRKLDVNDG